MTSRTLKPTIATDSVRLIRAAASTEASFSLSAGLTAPPEERSAGHIALAVTLLLAGVIHLALVPKHLSESLALGLGFVASGLTQVLCAAVILRRPSTVSLWLTLGVNAVSLAALILAVTIGLPVLAHGDTMGVLGPIEALDDLAALTGLVEVVSIIVVLRVLRVGRGRAWRSRSATRTSVHRIREG